MLRISRWVRAHKILRYILQQKLLTDNIYYPRAQMAWNKRVYIRWFSLNSRRSKNLLVRDKKPMKKAWSESNFFSRLSWLLQPLVCWWWLKGKPSQIRTPKHRQRVRPPTATASAPSTDARASSTSTPTLTTSPYPSTGMRTSIFYPLQFSSTDRDELADDVLHFIYHLERG